MSNFINEAAIRARAERYAAIVPADGAARARIARLFFAALRDDPRNARPAVNEEIETAPLWARRAAASGAALVWFQGDPAALAQMRRIAQRLAAAWADGARISANAPDPEQTLRRGALSLFENLTRMSLDMIDLKARAQARQRRKVFAARARAAQSAIPHCETQTFRPRGLRLAWRRLATTGDLARAGAALKNCTAPDRPQHRHYARALMRGEAEFWVLENEAGAILAELMASLPRREILDLRGPRNAPVDPASPAVRALIRKRRLIAPRAPNARDEAAVRRLRFLLADADIVVRVLGPDGERF